MPKKFNEAVYEVVGALDRAEPRVPVKEITRRLNENEAGLGHAIDISERSVYDYRAAYHREHGPPPSGDVDQDATAHSIASLKKRTLERIAIEIQHYEQVKPGQLTGGQATTLRRLFSTLDDMERREQVAEKRRGRPALKAKGNGQPAKEETAIERLAREAADRRGAEHGTDPDEPLLCKCGKVLARCEDASEQGTEA